MSFSTPIHEELTLPTMKKQDVGINVSVLPASPGSSSDDDATGPTTAASTLGNRASESGRDSAFREYWKAALKGLDFTAFPTVPHSLGAASPDHCTELTMASVNGLSGVAAQSIIRSAWALVVGQMTGSQDIVFGISMPNGGFIEQVPFRLSWSNDQHVGSILLSAEKQSTQASSFGLASLTKISQTCDEAEQACDFQTLITVWDGYHHVSAKRSSLGRRRALELDVILNNGESVLLVAADSRVISASLVDRLLLRLDHVITQLRTFTSQQTIAEVNLMTEQDLNNIWSWNRTVPSSIDRCVHSIIEDQIDAHPLALAICAWDGSLTYAELDSRANQIAQGLINAGLAPGNVIPLCVDKSMWANIAMLGVLKAGGALVMLDPTLPEERLQNIVNQVKANLIACSTSNHELSSRLCDKVFVVQSEAFGNQEHISRPSFKISPSSTAYIQFTSGSTGTPKGAVMTHRSVSSAIHHQLKPLGFTGSSRVYDFSSYSFDLSVYNALITFSVGGCLCVPTDAQRKNDLAGSIRNLKANTLTLTPSTAQTLQPEQVPQVHTIAFGGEVLRIQDALPWWKQARVVNMYGPCECTVVSTMNYDCQIAERVTDIGRGVGLNTWIVDPSNSQRLLPPGCVGELLLEGPLVGNGYLDDAEPNAETYLHDPTWLLRGHGQEHIGRHARLYKTGDLVRYNEDGNISFVARKDTQVKIRGQRVELGEVETRIQECLPGIRLAAEFITPQKSNPMLVVFVLRSRTGDEATLSDLDLYHLPTEAEDKIAIKLPSYMIPSIYLAIGQFPEMASGKLNRKRLREIGATLSPEKLVKTSVKQGTRKQPTSDSELRMQLIWAQVLQFKDPSVISIEDNFFRLGGDSIVAMKIVRSLRDHGLELSVGEILRFPVLQDIAARVVDARADIGDEIEPYSLLPDGLDITTVLQSYQLDPSQVQDVFPTTQLQEGLVSLSSQRSGDYVTQAILTLSSDTCIDTFCKAWSATVEAIPLLQTRFVQADTGLLQVVINKPISWEEAKDLQTYLEEDRLRPMRLGQTFTRYALIKDNATGTVSFILTAHHALHDGWSMGLIMETLSKLYSGVKVEKAPSFQKFIKYIQEQDMDKTSKFWKKSLEGCESVPFPALPASIVKPIGNSFVTQSFPNPVFHNEATASTLIRAAWALVVGCMVNSEDVVFGATFSGRSAELVGIDEIAGPTIATAPVRFNLDKSQTIALFLEKSQKQATDMIAYEQMGLSRIAKLSADCEQACKFQTLLVIQPEEISDIGSSLGRFREENAMQWSSTYGLVLQVQLGQPQSTITASFDSRVIDTSSVQSLLGRLEFVLNQLASPGPDSGKTLADISVLTSTDFETLLGWNAEVPETIDMCIHEVVRRRATDKPNHPAVCAHDGDFTYGQLDALSSKLACQLLSAGVCRETIVPLCFEKSKWAPLAMLAVLKAGGAFLLLDPSLPYSRLEVMVTHIDANLILTTPSCVKLSSSLVQEAIVIDDTFIHSPIDAANGHFNSDASSNAYIIFTSGSSGTPKGAVITHRNVVSAVTLHIPALNYDGSSRIYDFSSYSFGASLNNMFCALISGACLCIPGDEDRRSNLAASITSLRATDILMTPSSAEHLSPESVPTLRSLILGGEAVRAQDGNQWLRHLKLRTAYGQSESTTIATINSHSATAEQAMLIGRGVGLVTWVVDPSNHENLIPPGSIGELLVEGPAVGRGYFKDADKTAQVFISDPSWLIKAGRRGRLYKTGDLVRYTNDGTLAYMGRKDSQVKIRGQRIELGEVEYWVRESMVEADQVAVEAIKPKGPGGRQRLAAFIKVENANVSSEQGIAPAAKLIRIDVEVEKMLQRQLPSYMVPTVFITMKTLPMLPTGKMNRRELRTIGGNFTTEEIRANQLTNNGPKRQPTTEKQHQMQRIWSQVLGIRQELIDLDANFFQLGGDSITAMMAVGAARKVGLKTAVADIFQHRTLRPVAEHSRHVSTEEVSVKPFALVGGESDAQDLRLYISKSCRVEPDVIEDAYPCSPLQEGLISLASKRPGDYVMQAVLQLAPTVDITMFRQAWESAVRVASALRTRIVHHQRLGLIQVTMNGGIQWNYADSLESYLQADRSDHMTLATPLSRFALIKDDAGAAQYFVFTMHHALYDGWSLPLMLNMVQKAYSGGELKQETGFQTFINYVMKQIDDVKTSEYWQLELEGCEFAPYPALPTSIDQPVSDMVLHHQVSRPKDSYLNTTLSTLSRAAWAIVTSRATGSEDVIFGVAIYGRNAPVVNIDTMPAPAFATVPFRVRAPADLKVSDYLEALQQKATDMIPYEQLGLYRISKASSSARQACRFQTLLVVQQQSAKSFQESILGRWENHDQREFFNPYAIMLEVGLLDGGDLSLKASFDSRVISSWMVERLLQQFDFVVQQMEKTRTRQTLGEISTMTESDLQQIWSWNCEVPEPAADECLHVLIEGQAALHPQKLAISAWDGDFTYQQLHELSSRLSIRLVDTGIQEGQLVPLCFQKSKWTPIAVLAVLKAGGAFILLDPSLPEQRLKTIAEQSGSRFIITSFTDEPLGSRLSASVITVGEDLVGYPSVDKSFKSKRQSSNTPMFAVFTSGSTGTPKGALMSHINFTSGLHHQLELLGFDGNSRVFDFASYAFDIAVHNIFAAFVLGGCLCIPSEAERKGNLGKVMAEMRITIANITPSVGRLLSPKSLPDLKTIIFAGEELTTGDAKRWHEHVRVVNAYGPAECNIVTINEDAKGDSVHIGKGAGVNTWVVDPADYNNLFPPGSTGELLLEGPVVGLGYLNDPDKTAASFIQDPTWLVRGAPGQPGRSGRLYKTGDLVQYDQQGSLIFLGRKDAQVKIRGQRVELGEVEHWVKRCFPDSDQCVAEVITPQTGKAKVLVAFIQNFNSNLDNNSEGLSILALTSEMEKTLEENLPSYMIPSLFFALEKIPMTPTGKINRKQLCEMGHTFSAEQLADSEASAASTKEQPNTHTSRLMQSIWCQVLDLEPSRVGLDDSFLRLGGDSITAMKVVGEADKLGIKLSVADIFKYRTLRNVSRHSSEASIEDQTVIEPFSLLGGGIDVSALANEIAHELEVDDPSRILDIFPCTALQEGLISLGSKRPGDYVAHGILEISPDVDIAEFCHAWEEAVRSIDILRTRIVQHETLGLVQVVLNPGTLISWIKSVGLEAYLESDRELFMTVPGPLTRYALVHETHDSGRPRWFVWTIHHALYDGWSLPLMFQAVDQAYQGKALEKGPQFQAFLKHVQLTDLSCTKGYWQNILKQSQSIPFPALPYGVDESNCTISTSHRIECLPLPVSREITMSTLVRASWALVLSRILDSSDIVFGATVSGRNAPVRGINDMAAPTISTVPIRVKFLDVSRTKATDYLRSVQRQATDMIAYEQTGLHRIAKIAPDTKQACAFQNLIVLQPQGDGQKHVSQLGNWFDNDQKERFGTYPLTVQMQLGSDSIEIEAYSDSRAIEPWLVKKLLERLGHVIRQFTTAGPDMVISDISTITPQDLDDIWSWSQQLPQAFDQQVAARSENSATIASLYSSSGWVADPQDPTHPAAPGCVGELLLGISNIEQISSDDSEATLPARYIQIPAWIQHGHLNHQGHHGIVYRTGSLVRCGENGELALIARPEDVLGRLLGQRINLSEVEYWVRQYVPDVQHVVVEVVNSEDEDRSQALVAFLHINNGAESVSTYPILPEAVAELASRVPHHSLPSVFLKIGQIPRLPSGDPERQQLKNIGTSYFAKGRAARDAQAAAPKRQPRTPVEHQLQKIWGRVLDIEHNTIGLDDSFFHLGGDSVAAIKFTSEARKMGIIITVAELFKHPTIGEAAQQHVGHSGDTSTAIAPFALLSSEINQKELISQLASQLQVLESSIQDVYPCTPLQVGLMSLSSKRSGDYVMQATIELDPNCDIARFKQAWEATIRMTPVLRTRVASHGSFGLLQVVLDGDISWTESSRSLEIYLQHDRDTPMGLGQPLARYSFVQKNSTKPKYFVWTVHHTLYDGWSMSLVFDVVNRIFGGERNIDEWPQFQRFIDYLQRQDSSAVERYWRESLEGFSSSPYPEIPASLSEPPYADSNIEYSFTHLRENQTGIMASTLVRAAWALVAGRMGNQSDVVFGVTLSGRNAPVDGINEMPTPTITTVPVRIDASSGQKVSSYLEKVQNQAVAMIPFEQYGLQRIAKASPSAQQATQFQTLLVIQPQGDDEIFIDESMGKFHYDENQTNWFNSQALLIQVTLGKDQIKVSANFDSNVIPLWQVERLLQRLEVAVHQLDSAPPDMTVKQIDIMSQEDLNDVWGWYATVPDKVERCVHDLIHERAQRQPHACAISAWDGELTYQQLDNFSTLAAARLNRSSINSGLVLLCFHKSKWAYVSMLAAMKAGCGIVCLDPSLPESRLQNIAQQADAIALMCSPALYDLGSRLCDKAIFQIDQQFFDSLPNLKADYHPAANPSCIMYIVFTSGTTGTPKGIAVSHENFASALVHQNAAWRLTPETRMYEFSSYSFDMVYLTAFTTLSAGGCLCVPSNEDRNDICASLNKFKVNHFYLTPATSRIISPTDVPGLKTIFIGGDTVRAQDLEPWWDTTRIVNMYGPSECTPVSTVNNHATSPAEGESIGKPIGCSTWLVDPDDHNILLPPGATGELVIEGPIVGCGYWNDPQKTATSFINDPTWLIKGVTGAQGLVGHSGRRGRVFKTGDLARYDQHGSITHLGRKDFQVKIRGQRVELSEVEYRVKQCITEADEVVAEVITLQYSDRPSLAAFISLGSIPDAGQGVIYSVSTKVENTLAAHLPIYMRPSLFIALSKMPLSAACKTDRKALRQIGASFSVKDQSSQDGPKRQPVTENECQLHAIWCQVLKLEPSAVGLDDSLFKLGGDSISAMMITQEARKMNIQLGVSDIFRHPVLHDMASLTLQETVKDSESFEPFALVGGDKESISGPISKRYGIDETTVQNAYPCTPLQQGLISLTSKRPGVYVMQNVIKLNTTIDRFRKAWETVLATLPILRTMIVHHPDHGLLQLVSSRVSKWSESADLDAYVKADRAESMEIGRPLSRHAIVQDPMQGDFFVWTIHHALYDGWTMRLIIEALESALRNEAPAAWPSYQPFINYVQKQDDDTQLRYWKDAFSGYEGSSFPALPPAIKQPITDTVYEHQLVKPRDTGVTISTLIRGAWALVVGHTSLSEDIAFGITISGRNAPISGIENMPAPTITTVPFRVNTTKGQQVSAYLSSIQDNATGMIPFEQTGLNRISKFSSDCQQACDFQSLLIVHPQMTSEMQPTFGEWQDADQDNYFNTYAIMLELFLSQDSITAKASFDSRVITPWALQSLLKRLESTILQLANAGVATTINEINVVTQKDLELLWQLNGKLPGTVKRCVQDVVTDIVMAHPSAQAIEAWDGTLTYAELDKLTDNLSASLAKHGARPGQIIPVLSEKSMWTPVAALAILKTGAAFVLLDTSLPVERLSLISGQVGSNLIVASTKHKSLGSRLAQSVMELGPGTIDLTLHRKASHPSGTTQDPHSPMFLIFTSGSTGTPKGVMLSHANFASQIEHQAEILGYRQDSRVFDYAAYSFDVAVHNIFTTFAVGGCLCIPSDDDRKGDVSKVMADMSVSMVDLTPTVARLLDPSALPLLKTLTLSGEAVSVNDAKRWWGFADIINAYGPAEAGISTINHQPQSPEQAVSIGFGAGLATWIVHPDDYNILLPPGAVGELLLEGALVALGYLNDPVKTAASFIEDPTWLLSGTPTMAGRRGRLYKTGDLAQLNQDGSLTYFGRRDTQVKIRGQRIELGEIEHCLSNCLCNVGQVVVETIKPQDGQGKTVLAAFIAEDGQGKSDDDSSLSLKVLEPAEMEALQSQLTAAMIPSVFFSMNDLPRTATGKTNRKLLRVFGARHSLQQLAENTSGSVLKVQPSTAEQKQMQEIWASVLGLDPSVIGLEDSFIQLGGDSISAMKVVGEARHLGLQLSVAHIFRTPKLRDIVALTSSGPNTTSDVILPLSHLDPVELSSAQDRLWFLEQLYPGLSWYLMPFAIRFRGPLQLDALEKALQVVESRHDTLRSTFLTRDGVQLQQVHPFAPKKLPIVDISSGGEKALAEVLRKDQTATFNLTCEAGWRVTIYKLGQDHHVLSVMLHHINSDGWSIGVLRKELAQLYSAAIRGDNPATQLQPLPIQYRDYSIWQKQKLKDGEFHRQLEYWTHKLQTSRPAEFLPDKPRPAAMSGRADVHEFHLRSNLYGRIQAFCKQYAVTPFIVLLAAFRATHYRMTGAEDATIGSVNANRDRWELKDLIGFFVNMQCLRITLQDDSFETLVRRVQQTTTESFDNQDIPFEQIVGKLNRERDLSRNPIVQVIFALHVRGNSDAIDLEGVECEALGVSPSTKFDLELHFFEQEDALQGGIVYSTDLYSPKSIACMLDVFKAVLDGALSEPQSKISSLPLLTTEGLTKLNSVGLLEIPQTDYPRESSVVDIFRRQVALHPNKVAVKDSTSQITFSGLNDESDSVARWLTTKGFPSETLIPVVTKRGVETIIAYLGIMKAGLAYLPLNPDAPIERTRGILSSIQGSTIILLGRDIPPLHVEDTPFTTIQSVLKTKAQPSLLQRLRTPKGPSALSLAYVLYTSGSTGKPKGVMIEHRGILRLVLQSNVVKHLTVDGTVAHMANLIFDASTLEIYMALLNGLTLVCLDHETILDNRALQKTFLEEKIGALFISPAHLKQVITDSPKAISQLDMLMVGGERFNPGDCIQAKKLLKGHMMNVYGPTENTGLSTLYNVNIEDSWANGIPIGQTISNSGAVITDSQLRVLPLGVVGELVVTGDGLARSYVERKQNADRFVTVEVNGQHLRAYRTGDLVRFRPTDGQMEFFGRIDSQVKIRGQRVELLEIEHVLLGHDLVTDAVAIVQQGEGDEGQLHAFVKVPSLLVHNVGLDGEREAVEDKPIGDEEKGLPARQEQEKEVQKIREELEANVFRNLPSYMKPKTITILGEFPLNTSSKVDRKALAETLRTQTPLVREVRQPKTKTEKQLQEIWARVLKISPDGVGLDDGFFSLGGHSISAMKVVAQARQLGIELAVSDIFRTNSLEELALQTLNKAVEVENDEETINLVDKDKKRALLAELNSSGFSISSTNVEDILPLTSMQTRYIEEGKMCGQFAHYFYLDFKDDLNIDRLETSVHQLLRAIPILRAAFVGLGGKYWQVVPQSFNVPWLVRDVRETLTEAAHNFCRADLTTISHVQPPAFFMLLRSQTEGSRMVIRMSHAQYDGASIPSIIQALIDGYFELPKAMGPDYSTFLKYAARHRPASLEYWRDLLQDSTLTTIQPHLTRHDRQVEPKGVAAKAEVALPSLEGQTTTATLASTAWALLLAHLTGGNDIVYGHLVTGRNARIPGIQELVGPCLNIAPVRAIFSPSETPRKLLRRLQMQFSSMGDADSLGYEDIIKACTNWPSSKKFESIIHHANIDEHPEFAFGQDKIRMDFFQNSELVPLHILLSSYPLGNRLQFNLMANTHIMSGEVAESLVNGLCTIVNRIVAAPDEPLIGLLDGLRLQV